MAAKPRRYKDLERIMTIGLCADAALFVFYMVAAGNGVIWLKVVLTLLCSGVSGLLLWLLYITNELMRQRSLWITTGAVAIVICLFFSLILNFPSPNKYKQDKNTKPEKSASIIIERI